MGAPRDYSLTFAGAGEREVKATGKFLRVLATPVSNVFVAIDGGSELERAAGQAIHVPEGFSRVNVRTPTAQTVVVSISDAHQDDNRAVLDVSVVAVLSPSTNATKKSMVTIAAGATQKLCDANADRNEVRISIPSDQPGGVWFSDAPAQVANEGGWLEPGMIDYPATRSALYARNPHATLPVVVSVLDMESP